MNKQDIRSLTVLPVSSFLIVAVAALFFSTWYFKSYNEHEKENRVRQQKFERFVENIKNGKWQLTTDRWIEGMRLQRSEAEADYESILPLIEFVQFIGWFGFILAACNVLVVLHVKNTIKKRQGALLREG